MDTQTSASILEKVKAAKEKQANEGGALDSVIGGGLAGGMLGVAPGAMMGIGYGHSKGREGAGAVRGATRGAMTLGGIGAGGALGSHMAESAGATPTQVALATLLGSAGGGIAGWKGTDAMIGKDMEEKRSLDASLTRGINPTADAFSDSLQGMAAGQLRSDALKDIANVGLTSLGVGAAGRGLIGLVQMLRANKPKKTRSGPNYLPLPYPAEVKTASEKQAISPELVGKVFGRALNRFTGASHAAGLPMAPTSQVVARKAATNTIGGLPVSGMAQPALVQEGQRLSRFQNRAYGYLYGKGVKPESTAVGTQIPHTPVYRGYGSGPKTGPVDEGRPGLAKWYAKPDGTPQNMIDKNFDSVTLPPISSLVKRSNFLGGDSATTKSGIPWYGPAMLLGGLGGLGLGFKGMDKILEARRAREQQKELEAARSQFHDALLSQYDEPIKVHPDALKKGSDSTMEKVGQALNVLFDRFFEALQKEDSTEKTALDVANLAGQATGGYGMYAGLSGLLAGALMYDKISKRSRRAVLESALKQRQRRKFMQSPTEIMAVPEPVPVGT